MQTIAIKDIIVLENRQRKTFRPVPMTKLQESIRTKGLLHPIVLRNDARTLVAGERRIKAITKLHSDRRVFNFNGEQIETGRIPFSIVGQLTEDNIIEAELEENIIREDLPWQEQVVALKLLSELRVRQNPKQTRSDTARELEATTGKPFSTSMREIHNAEIIAPHLDDPKVAAAKTARDAFNIVATKIEREFEEDLLKKTNIEASKHKLITGDLREEMKKLKAETFALIIADPPYGVNADKFGDFAKMAHNYHDTKDEAVKICEAIAFEGFRVAKKKAHLYIFCDVDLFCVLKTMVADAGWVPWRTPIIWTKGGSGHAPNADLGPRRVYELILFATKGKRKITKLYLDHIPMSVAHDKDHAAEKPSDLYALLMEHSCYSNDTVLDPCCGSGTIFPAANKQRLIATGIELDTSFAAIAKSRMNEGKD